MSKKLVLFGDSLFGRCSKSQVLLLESKLDQNYDVYNCATGGWDTNDLVKKAPYLARLQPEVVLISVGTNDASPWKQVTLEKFETNLVRIARAFSKSRTIFFPPPPVNEQRRPAGKEIENNKLKDYYQALVNFCLAEKLEYLDSWSFLMPHLDGSDDYHDEDGVHFSDEGYEILMDGLARVVEP